MTRRLAALGIAVVTAWAYPIGAQDTQGKVKREDVKTWTMTLDGKEYSVRPATPAYDGDTGLFHLSSAYTLPKGKLSVSAFRDNLDRDPKDLDISTFGATIAYGATRKLELFGSLGFLTRVDADAVAQTGFSNDFPFAGESVSSSGWQKGLGDAKVGLKYNLLNDYLGDSVGLALRGLVKIPTADEAKGLGTGKISARGDLILSKSLNKKADLHASVGYQINQDPDGRNIGNAFKWGVGLNVPACKMFQLQAEATGSMYGSADFDQTSPIDVVVGPVIWFKPGLFIRPALSANLGFDDRGLGSSLKSYVGRQIAIGWHSSTPCCEIYIPPVAPPPPQNRPPTVACELEKSQILPGETVRCRATASDPDGDPLTYQWSASDGRVTGSGATATYDSTGVTGPASVTVTVSVSDGRGGTAQSKCSLRVEEPKKAPVPWACTSGGFPRNLARLNNMDKACLDDITSRVKQDPRGRVVVTGHADQTERRPDVIARKRAEAIKSYLVKEKGVEDARISVISAGAKKPVDTGKTVAARAKNRRVEVVFVPEGATLPEDDD